MVTFFEGKEEPLIQLHTLQGMGILKKFRQEAWASLNNNLDWKGMREVD